MLIDIAPYHEDKDGSAAPQQREIVRWATEQQAWHNAYNHPEETEGRHSHRLGIQYTDQ